ncbi:hypothetical protein ACHAWF_009547 [Thalassiosira exigua]
MARRRPKQRPQDNEESSSSSSAEGLEGEGSASSSSDDGEGGKEQGDGSESDVSGDGQVENDEAMNASHDDSSGSSVDEGSVDEDEEATADAAASPPPVSKSWTTLTTHSPCYTGGTVAFSNVPAMTATSTMSDGGQPSSEHFILAQRGGDVSVIEASTGLLLRTVRKGKMFQGGHDISTDYNENEEEEDDDEEMMDAEAMTAFALSPNNVDLVAVTRSHLVRRFSLAIPAGDEMEIEDTKQLRSNKSKDPKESVPLHSVTSITDPAKLTFSFGKSGHSLPVTKVAFHPSGIFFATGSVDGLVKIWDVRNGYATHALHPTSSPGGGGGSGRYAVTCLEWRPTSTSLILAIGREDGSISIHDLLLNAHIENKASLPVAVLRDHLSAVTCVAWSSEVGGDEKSLTSPLGARKHGAGVFFSSGRDSVINSWLISEEQVKDADGPKRKKKKSSQERSGQQQQVLVSVTYRRVRTLPVYEQVEGMILLSHKCRPVSETKKQQETLEKKDVVLATCGTKGQVRLWKATSVINTGSMHNMISDLTPLAVQIEDDAFGEENGGYTSLHLTSLSTTHLSPMLVAVDSEHNMTFLRVQWCKNDGALLELKTDRAIVGHNGEILDLSIVPQPSKPESSVKHTVAVATNSSQVRVFGLCESKADEQSHPALSPMGMLDGHAAIVLSIDASPCGRYLATASKDKTMRLWHISSLKCLAVATGHTEAVGAVALSKKMGCYDVGGKAAEKGAGAFVVSASKDRTVKVWTLPGSAVLNRWADDGGGKPLNARLSARAHEKVSVL